MSDAALAEDAVQPPPAWEDVKDQFTQAYPQLDPQKMQEHYEQARTMTLARQRADAMPKQGVGGHLARKSIAFASPALTVGENEGYQGARDRFLKGEALTGDYDLMARYEKRQEDEGKLGLGGQVLSALAHVPAVAGEAYMTAPLTMGLGTGGGLLKSALRLGARAAIQTPAMPSLYAPEASQRAVQEGGHWTDPRNLAPALGMGVLQNIVLGSLGEVGGGIANPATRFVARVGVGMGAQQGVDIAASAIDQVLPEAYQTKTQYGLLGDLMQGKGGDALQKATVQAVTFAAFTAMHGNPREAKDIRNHIRDVIDRSATPEEAARILGEIHEPLSRDPAAPAAAPPTAAPGHPEGAGELPGGPETQGGPQIPVSEVQGPQTAEQPAQPVPGAEERPSAPAPAAAAGAEPGVPGRPDAAAAAQPAGGGTVLTARQKADALEEQHMAAVLRHEDAQRALAAAQKGAFFKDGPAQLTKARVEAKEARLALNRIKRQLSEQRDAAFKEEAAQPVVRPSDREGIHELVVNGQKAGEMDLGTPSQFDGKRGGGDAPYMFPDLVKPGQTVARIHGIEVDAAQRGKGLGQKLYLEAMKQGGADWYYNSQATPEATRTLLSMEKKGLIELHWKGGKPIPGEEGGIHLVRLAGEPMTAGPPGQLDATKPLAPVGPQGDAYRPGAGADQSEYERIRAQKSNGVKKAPPVERQPLSDDEEKLLRRWQAGEEMPEKVVANLQKKGYTNQEEPYNPGDNEGPMAKMRRAGSQEEYSLGFQGAPPGLGQPGTARAAPTPALQNVRQIGEDTLDHRNAEMARRNEIARVALGKGEKFFQTYSETAKDAATRQARFLEFTDPYQHGQIGQMPPAMREHAQKLQKLWDGVEKELLDRGILKSTEQNHLGQMWKDPHNPNATPEEIAQRVMSRRPLAGRESFKHQKVHQDFRAGLDAGLEPVSWNPITIQKMKLAEAYRSIFAHDIRQDLQDRDLWQFVRLGQRGPEGFRPLEDKSARVFAPPETPIREYYDKNQMEGLLDQARTLGVDVETTLRGKPGTANEQDKSITRRFATGTRVLSHEIGHQLAYRYPDFKDMKRDPLLAKEMRALADERWAGQQPSDWYKKYVRSGTEKEANLVDAWLNAPELLDSVAPNAGRAFSQFVAAHPELKGLANAKPSMVLGEHDMMLRLAGPQLTGNYHVPNEVADVLERHMSKGLQGNVFYNAARRTTNFLNMMQLAGPGFHAGFTLINAQIQRMSELIQRLSRLPYQVATGTATKQGLTGLAKSVPGSLVPGVAMGEQMTRGAQMGKEYYQPGSRPASAEDVAGLEMAGGRARMDPFYGGSALTKVSKGVRQLKAGGGMATGEALKNANPINMIEALAEAVNKPVLDGLVPLAKRGALAQMMAYEKERLGPNATVDQLREAFGKNADSVDNRFGEMVYDNTHMNKSLKDAFMVGLRSLGWNMGTWRELGGGVKDIPKSVRGLFNGQGVSQRTAYVLALATVPAMFGTGLGYAMTGQGPQSLNDAYFPKTGKKREDGSDDRLAPPSYMKDIAGVFNRYEEGPYRVFQNAANMAVNKANPIIPLLWEAFGKNEDYYGREIRNPEDTTSQQTLDVVKHLAGAGEPFASRGVRQQLKQGDVGKALLPLAGFSPAPAYITRSPEEQRAREEQSRYQLSPHDKRLREEGLLPKKSNGLKKRTVRTP